MTVPNFGINEICFDLKANDNQAENSAHGGYSSVGRAPDCGSGCRGFESLYPPQFISTTFVVFFIFYKHNNQI